MTRSGGVCRYVDAVCTCSWSGRLPATADCPKCGRNWKARMTPDRARMLDKIEAHDRAEMVPTMRDRLIELGVIAPASPPRQPGGNGRHRPPPRAHAVTTQGKAANAAFRAMFGAPAPDRVVAGPAAITGAEAIERRERAAIAGMTAARHADLSAWPLPDVPKRLDPTSPCPRHPRLMAGECLTCDGNGTWIPKAVAR